MRRLVALCLLGACASVIFAAQPTASAAAGGETLRLRHHTTAIYLTSPCITCDFLVPAISVIAEVGHCTPGDRYFFDALVVQDGVTLTPTEDPQGGAEGIPCEKGRLTVRDEVAGDTLHPGSTSVTGTLTKLVAGEFPIVATDEDVLTIPKT